ncbi:MAG: DUF748 domain-containing protein [Verrucomicrobiota bacterium JB024]|nr:DUF748 domain-containing protein [Verrucomicrobiota bacterium JB024]
MALVLFYTVFGFWGVPLLIRYVGLSKVNKSVAGHGEIEAIYFNPYSYCLEIEGMKGYTPDGEEAIGLKELRVNFDFLSLFRDNLRFEEITLVEPSLSLIIDEEGKVNIESAVATLQEQVEDQVQEQAKSEKPFEIPVIEVGVFQVENASLGAKIENLAEPFERNVRDLSFVMRDIRTSPDRDNPYHFNFQTLAGEDVDITGNIKLDPLSSDGSIRIDRIHLPDFYKLSNDALGFNLAGGDMSFSADYAFRPVREPRELFIQNGRFLLEGLDLRPRGSDEPFQTLERFEMNGISVFLFRGAVAIDKVDVVNGTLKVVRDKAGVLSLMRYLLPAERQAELEQQVAQEKKQDQEAREFIFGLIADQQDIGLAFTSAWQQLQEMVEVTWDLKVSQLNVENQNLVLVDEVPARPVSVTLGDINLTVTDMANQSETPFPFDLSLRVNETGEVTAKGTFTAVPPGTDFEYNVTGIDLSAFAPYVEASSPATLHSATFANKGTLKASFPDQALPTVEARFNMSLSDFDATVGDPLYAADRPLRVTAARMAQSGRVSATFPDEGEPDVKTLIDATVDTFALALGEAEPAVAWSKLSVTGIDMATVPLKAKIDTVTLDQFKATVVRKADGNLNLMELAPQVPEHTASAEPAADQEPSAPAETTSTDEPATAPAPEVASSGAAPAFDPNAVGLNRFVLKNATVAVTDESVSPAANFTLNELNVNAGPFSLAPGAMTDVDTALKLESGGTGSIAVKGSALLVDPLAQSKMTITLDSVPMAGFAGYAVQAVGSPMTGGSFSADLAYDIKTDELQGDNKIKIKKVRFGQRVPETKAPKLPLDLGIAVMENRDGVIDLNVPVKGSLDDPQFTLNHVVQTALGNIFEKVVTAPFALLGSAFGSGGEAPPSMVAFSPGSSDLPAAAQEPLALLAQALYDRPSLALKLVPSVDPEKDVADFRDDFVQENIDDLVAQGMDAEDAIEKLFDERFPEGLPPNPDGTEVTLTPGVMRAKLVEVQEVPDTALQLLAHQRAEEVKAFILSKQQLDTGRVTENPPEGGFARDGAKVSFELGVAK